MAKDAESHTNSAMGRGGGEGGGQTQPVSLILPEAGERAGGRGEGGRSVLVLDAACLHLVPHYISLSPISVLLWGPLSIQKRLMGSRTVS